MFLNSWIILLILFVSEIISHSIKKVYFQKKLLETNWQINVKKNDWKILSLKSWIHFRYFRDFWKIN